MDGKGNLKLDFFDVYGDRLDDKVDISLDHIELSHSVFEKDFSGKKVLNIEDLITTHNGTYRVMVFPMRHRPVSRFIRVLEGKTARHAFVLPVDCDRVMRAKFPDYDSLKDDLKQVLGDSNVEGLEGKTAEEIYEALDDHRKAGLLNVYTKMKTTRFANGRDAFSYVTSFSRIRAQRFFARVQKELRDEVKNSLASDLFHEVSGALHTPPPDFTSAGSFKTRERYGNLQLSFFGNPQTLEFMIDADIDDAQGIEHIFQVIRPWLTGKHTHPYDVHEILLGFQNIDPGYRLFV